MSVREALEQDWDGPAQPEELSRPLTEDEKSEQHVIPAADARDAIRSGQVKQQQEGLADARHNLSGEERFAQATQAKTEANQHYARGGWRVALVGYLAGIWFLKRGDPPCPQLMASEEASLDGVVSALGAGTGDDTMRTVAAASALRVACHLNLAAAALQLNEWAIATTACEFVLSVEPQQPKALFRLAKAQEGANELHAAERTVGQLLQAEPSNADARKLLDGLRRRATHERKMYANMFGRARAQGGDLYDQSEEEAKAAAQAEERRAAEPKHKVSAAPAPRPPRCPAPALCRIAAHRQCGQAGGPIHERWCIWLCACGLPACRRRRYTLGKVSRR